MGFFDKLKNGLSKTKNSFDEKINNVFSNFRKVDEELLDELEEYKDEDIFIIGGESIYRMMLPYCDKAYVTRTDFAYDADTYFPNLDEMPEWKIVKESEEETYFDIEYQFVVYGK